MQGFPFSKRQVVPFRFSYIFVRFGLGVLDVVNRFLTSILRGYVLIGMASANFPDGYAVNPDPRTLLLPDPDAIPSVLGDKMGPLVGGLMGATTAVVYRYLLKRPLLSGIQVHIAWSLGLAGIGYYFAERKNQYNMDRDAVFKHYIELHPEDFPPPERKKVGEVFKTFLPVR